MQTERKFLSSCQLDRGGVSVLRDEQIETWKEEGCLLVEGLIPNELIEAATAQMNKSYAQGSSAAEQDFGSNGKMEFPCSFKSLNEITLHPRMLHAVKQLLGEEDIRLTQSDAWPKFGKETSNGPYDNR